MEWKPAVQKFSATEMRGNSSASASLAAVWPFGAPAAGMTACSSPPGNTTIVPGAGGTTAYVQTSSPEPGQRPGTVVSLLRSLSVNAHCVAFGECLGTRSKHPSARSSAADLSPWCCCECPPSAT